MTAVNCQFETSGMKHTKKESLGYTLNSLLIYSAVLKLQKGCGQMQKDCCRKKGRCFLAVLTVLCAIALGSGDMYAADTKDEATAKTAATKEKVWISGETVGVYLQTKGVLVADIGTVNGDAGKNSTPAEHIARAGDYIRRIGKEDVRTKQQLIELMRKNHGEKVSLSVVRGGETIEYALQPAADREGSYKLGLWVQDDLQGIGTLTFVRKDGSFGALGHGISDSGSGGLLQVEKGQLYKAGILEVQKGKSGTPGELRGSIYYADSELLGTISANTGCGIFGRMKTKASCSREVPVAGRSEVHAGEAQICCNTGDGVQMYNVQIDSVRRQTKDKNKSFEICVTDKTLLAKTGGIVQGMSGAPILQDGQLIGAVTHVFVNDPKRGYGVFAEDMMEAA